MHIFSGALKINGIIVLVISNYLTNYSLNGTLLSPIFIAHILGILLMNSYEIQICSEATFS